tara:strand:+ start:24 stop:500 length:477 start_codon:yes stop_codon:yes gene_type:complete
MTSNLGASEAEKNSIGFGSLERLDEDEKAMKEFFKPEFRNRIDVVCKFNKLDDLTKRKIVTKFFDELAVQLKPRNIRLNIDEASVDLIMGKGFDENMGARPVARTIDRCLRVPISKLIMVDKDVKDCKIKIRTVEKQLLLRLSKDNNAGEVKEISLPI